MTVQVDDEPMGRAHRIDVAGGFHHVMNRGANRQIVFFCDADRVDFGRLLSVVSERLGIEVLAYCLLDNHYHLLIHCPDGGLSEAMHLIGSVFTRHANERAGRDGPLFRGRFHAVPVLDDDQLVVTTRYIHRNALDVAGVSVVDGYRWSSHRAYLGLRRQPDFLDTGRVMEMFNNDVGAFHDFVRSDLVGTPVLPPDARMVSILNMSIDMVFQTEAAAPNVARTVAILLSKRFNAADRAGLCEQLGFSSSDAVAQAFRRATRRAVSEPRLDTAVEVALSMLAVHVVPGTT